MTTTTQSKLPAVPAEHRDHGNTGTAELTITGQVCHVYWPDNPKRWPTLRLAVTTAGDWGGTGEVRISVQPDAARGVKVGDLVSLTARGKGKSWTKDTGAEVRMIEWSCRDGLRIVWSAPVVDDPAPADDSDMPF